jgi:hypothetical protein
VSPEAAATLGGSIALGIILAAGLVAWLVIRSGRDATILRARRREQRRRDRLRRLEDREAARRSDAEARAHRRGVAD